MSKGSLLLVPEGGLANRMRTIASAHEHCRRIDSKLEVVWFKGWGMQAAFDDIFENADDDVMTLRSGDVLDALLYQEPKRRNLYIPAMAQRLMFERRIYAKSMFNRKRDGFDFEAWGKGHRCYMDSYHQFNEFPDALYSRLFRPVDDVKKKIAERVCKFSSYTVGMHIRRTDNSESIKKSPLSLFTDKANEELLEHSDMKIFLATDSEKVKTTFRQQLGDRVVTTEAEASRESVEGIRDGVADMFALAACQRIYGSAGSSFSTMAASIANGKAAYECLSL